MLKLETTTTPAVRAILEGEAFLKYNYLSTQPDYDHIKDDNKGHSITFYSDGTCSILAVTATTTLRRFEEFPDRFEIIERAEFVEALAKAINAICSEYPEID